MKNAEPMLRRPSGPFMKLREHQMKAVERFKDTDTAALFFEMGCGKSLTLLRIAQEKWKACEIEGLLVIAPNDVHRQWYDELVNGTEAGEELEVPFEAQCFGGRGGQDDVYPFKDGVFWFLSVNVDTFSTPEKWKEVTEWANLHRIMIAVDEATIIKNPKAKRTERILYEFNRTVRRRGRIVSTEKVCEHRAVLTGTPVTNGPCDLWSIMEFLEPNYFGMNWWSFRDYFAMFTQVYIRRASGGGYKDSEVTVLLTEESWRGIKRCCMYEEARQRYGISEDTWRVVCKQAEFQGPYKHADQLKEMIAPVSAFKLLEECEDMPERQSVVRQVGMSKEQARLYNQALKEMQAEFKGAYTDARNQLVLYLRLQQISSGFLVNTLEAADGGWDDEGLDYEPGEVVWIGESCPKLDALMRDIDEAAKPLIVMTRYTAEAARIYELCGSKWRTGLFTGWKVVGGVDALKAGELDVLVANSQKAARGFNLQAAHTMLFYSNTFSMETRQQAEFRIFRIGQKRPCLYVDYIASPVEKKIMDALKMKKGLLDYIRNEDRSEMFSSLKSTGN